MTKYSYTVNIVGTTAVIAVTRLADDAVKEFSIAGKSNRELPHLIRFMDSITDELAVDYFPRPRAIKDKSKKELNG
jgi:hypothetical protein